MLTDDSLHALNFYRTTVYPCGYLPNKMARSQVLSPSQSITPDTYDTLLTQGFRRSGLFIYRPDCDDCKACTAIRVKVQEFLPKRNQQRAWKKHRTLSAKQIPLQYQEEHYALYLRYQTQRHLGGGMDQDSRYQYSQFLLQTRVDTQLVEFRDQNQALRIVSMIDILADGLSSVYTFFDPDIKQSAYGTYNILWQIAQAQKMNLPYLYLGYWIYNSKKMAYKAEFRPFEFLQDGSWLVYS